MSRFTYSVLKSTWGVYAVVAASSRVVDAAPQGACHISSRVHLHAPRVPEATLNRYFLELGLKRVAASIEAAWPDGHIVIVLDSLDLSYADYQPEGVEAAIMGWAAEEFDFAPHECEVVFDRHVNHYFFFYARPVM